MDRQLNEGIPSSVASFVSEAEQRLSELTKRQFRYMVLATLLPIVVLITAVFIIPNFVREPSDTEIIALLDESNKQLSEMVQALLRSSPPVTTTTRALEVVLLQADLHEQAIKELQQSQREPSPQTQSIIQLVGSAAILALLGALGLQRLQNIDTEINNVRQSVFAQAEAHAKSTRESLQSHIDDQVQQQFIKARSEIQKLADQSREIATNIQQQSNEILAQIRGQVDVATAELAEVRALLDKYPWLRSQEQFVTASRIHQLASVEQAQSLAEDFRRTGDVISAREALKAIVQKELPGDQADFHNAFSEAMRIKEPSLALEIVDIGLKSFPDQFDLVADKTKALQSLGRAQEARNFIEEWRRRKPNEFARSWRPVVFYEDLFDSIELTPEALSSLESAFEEVTAKLPTEIKVWSEYADLMVKQNRLDEALSILRKGTELNPYSQQLNFVLGDLLLKRGQSEEAVEYLEKALHFDYQDQYQHDVNQYAVRARLAQAYEAVERLGEARRLYQSIVDAIHPEAYATLKEYARNRLAAIALIEGGIPDEKTVSPEGLSQVLGAVMKELLEGEEGKGGPGQEAG